MRFLDVGYKSRGEFEVNIFLPSARMLPEGSEAIVPLSELDLGCIIPKIITRLHLASNILKATSGLLNQ